MTDHHSDGTDGRSDGANDERVEISGDAFSRDDASDLSTLLSVSKHFYRGEMDRITTWRTRMDQTTNWAVVLMAAILTWAFTSSDNPHYVILVGALAVTAFLFIEAQRFQEYDAWRGRILVLQRNLFAEGFDPRGPESENWRTWLSDDLREPAIHMSLVYALGHRLQHVYLPLLTVLLAAWWLRVTVFAPDATWRESAGVAEISGTIVVAVVVAFYLAAAALTAWSLRQEVRREFEFDDGGELP